MSIRHKILIILILPLFAVSSSYSEDNDTLFSMANDQYSQQKYGEAISSYKQIILGGNATFEVFFNIGNAYYKTGELGQAILNYERAKRLSPTDEDVNFNLKMANRETIDKIDPLPKVFYKEWWDGYIVGQSLNTRSIVLILLLWLSVLALSLYVYFRSVTLKKTMFLVSLTFLVFTLFYTVITKKQHTYLNERKAAIILDVSIYIKSSPDSESSNLFMLHEGTKLDILDELNEWYKVRIANGNIGWTTKESIEVI